MWSKENENLNEGQRLVASLSQVSTSITLKIRTLVSESLCYISLFYSISKRGLSLPLQCREGIITFVECRLYTICDLETALFRPRGELTVLREQVFSFAWRVSFHNSRYSAWRVCHPAPAPDTKRDASKSMSTILALKRTLDAYKLSQSCGTRRECASQEHSRVDHSTPSPCSFSQ